MNRGVKITDYTMLDDYEVQGIWWLPKKKENELSGSLYSEKGRIYLDLLGSFSELFNDDNEYSYIHGFTIKGEEITLISNIKINEKHHIPGIPHQRFIVHYFIVGGHFTEIYKLKFRSVNVVSTFLTRWFNSRPFKTKQTLDDESNTLIEHTTSYVSPEVYRFYLPSIGAEISNHYIFNSKGDGIEHMSFFYNESFRIIPSEWEGYDWFENKVFSLNRLLILLTNETIHFKKVVLEGDFDDLKKTGGIKVRKKYHLYFSQGDVDIKEKLHPNKLLFTFHDIKDNLKKVFDNWFMKESYLKNFSNLHFNDFFNRKLDLETKFLNAIQALEVYHRSLGYGKLFSDEEKDNYLQIVNDAISNLLPSEVHKEINEKLKYFNEYSLSKRLKDIKNNFSQATISYLFQSNKKAKNFIGKSVNTRNYLTHYEEKEQEKKFKGIELYHATILLKVLSVIQLFKELGLEEDIILNAVKKNHKLSQQIPESKSKLKLI